MQFVQLLARQDNLHENDIHSVHGNCLHHRVDCFDQYDDDSEGCSPCVDECDGSRQTPKSSLAKVLLRLNIFKVYLLII